jgi:hypothetical protein
MRRAQQLDPLSLLINVDLSAPFYLKRQYDQAIEQCRKVIEMDTNFYLAHCSLGLACVHKGEFTEGIAELRMLFSLLGCVLQLQHYLLDQQHEVIGFHSGV